MNEIKSKYVILTRDEYEVLLDSKNKLEITCNYGHVKFNGTIDFSDKLYKQISNIVINTYNKINNKHKEILNDLDRIESKSICDSIDNLKVIIDETMKSHKFKKNSINKDEIIEILNNYKKEYSL